jgi:RNA polymerase sigma-70 factor (ECF subfamily)
MDTPKPSAQQFAPTRWSVVLRAAKPDSSSQAREALASLCQAYWYPLYAYVRRLGHNPHDAQDLTQEFFARLLQKHYLAGIQREGGRFRSFLLAALKGFLANEWDRAHAQKRGGGRSAVSIDATAAETRFAEEPADELTPERIFERQWARALLAQVLARLRAEHVAAGKAELFEQLSASLSQPRGAVPYVEIAGRLGMTEGAVKMAVQRLRGRYRDLLRAEIAETVADAGEVEAEIRHLFAAFAG